MKKLIFIPLILAGCSSSPSSSHVNTNAPAVQLILDSKLQQMSRNEVIHATQECEGNGMRAVPVMTKRTINGMMSDIIIDIQCMPKLRLTWN